MSKNKINELLEVIQALLDSAKNELSSNQIDELQDSITSIFTILRNINDELDKD